MGKVDLAKGPNVWDNLLVQLDDFIVVIAEILSLFTIKTGS